MLPILPKLLNQFLTVISVVVRQRHLPDLADTIKAAAVLVGQDHLEDYREELAKLIKVLEARVIADGDITPQDLILETSAVAKETGSTDGKDDFMADLDGAIDEIVKDG